MSYTSINIFSFYASTFPMHGDDADLDTTTNTSIHRHTGRKIHRRTLTELHSLRCSHHVHGGGGCHHQIADFRGAREAPRISLWCTGSTRTPPGAAALNLCVIVSIGHSTHKNATTKTLYQLYPP